MDSNRRDRDEQLRALMTAYQRGDIDAFDGLYVMLAPVLRRFARAAAHDQAWADDLVQATFLQLHRARRTYSGSCRVRPWALAIARHVFLTDSRNRLRPRDIR